MYNPLPIIFSILALLGLLSMILGIYIAETANEKNGRLMMVLSMVLLTMTAILMGDKFMAMFMAIVGIIIYKQYKSFATETTKDVEKKS